ncbi:MAG: hypothetical protein RL333_878 [Pseudomonadota bacterium]|jgi:hypothetical protein
MMKFVLLLVALSPVVFLIGMVKPKWILFWMKEPDRLIASSVGLLMFMGTFTYYSELRVQHKAEQELAQGASKDRSPENSNDLHLNNAR